MIRNIRFLFLIALFAFPVFCNGQDINAPTAVENGQIKPVKENQILYNGQVWRNKYLRVKGNQFLFAEYLLPSSLSINGKEFRNVGLSYDIFNDQIITTSNTGYNIQLNKEMVDSFSLSFQNRNYRFFNMRNDTLEGVKGYVNVLYNGKTSLYLKFRKEIQPLAVDDKYDLFFESHKIYFVKDGHAYTLNRKKDLMKVLEKEKIAINNYIKKNKLKISKQDPESFVPVVRFYDSLSK
jgi:hypothetical protein